MKQLHNLDRQECDDLLRPDLQRIHEDEPDPAQNVPDMTDLSACIRYIFGGHGW